MRRAVPLALLLALAAPAPGCRGGTDAPEETAGAPADAPATPSVDEDAGEPVPLSPSAALTPAERALVGAWRLEEGPADRVLLIVESGRRVYRAYRDGRPSEVGTWALGGPTGPLTLRSSGGAERAFERVRGGDTLVLEGPGGRWRGARER